MLKLTSSRASQPDQQRYSKNTATEMQQQWNNLDQLSEASSLMAKVVKTPQ